MITVRLSPPRSGRRPAAPQSPEPQRLRRDFLSPGLRPFLARQESVSAAILRYAAARAGAASIVFGFQIAIEAAVVAGSKTARRSDMANIGSFKKSGQEFQGEIVTLSLQTKGVRIVPETDRTNDNAPSHRAYVSRADYA
jgi:hypothetical protein